MKLAVASIAVLLAFVCLADAISRNTVMSRAQKWVDAKVPYSQSGSHEGYRTDCSGYVSMSWGLRKPGLTTRTLPGVSKSISKNDLKKGDLLLSSGHAVLFGGWFDNTKAQYWAYEEANSRTGTVKRKTPYPYWTAGFAPRRYNNITDN